MNAVDIIIPSRPAAKEKSNRVSSYLPGSLKASNRAKSILIRGCIHRFAVIGVYPALFNNASGKSFCVQEPSFKILVFDL